MRLSGRLQARPRERQSPDWRVKRRGAFWPLFPGLAQPLPSFHICTPRRFESQKSPVCLIACGSVAAFKHAPGNANLPIGASKDAIHENGVPMSVATGAAEAVWHSRGYLPHFESTEATQHVTFHLADSLPQAVLQRWKAELANLPADKRNAERRRRAEDWIDAGHGSCVLRHPLIADMAQASLLSFDSRRYRLLAWVVMPNHIHVLFQPMP